MLAELNPRARIQKRFDISLTIFFVVIVSLPLSGILFDMDPASVEENRQLAPIPDIFLSTTDTQPLDFSRRIKAFPYQFKAYIKDHFGFRNFLVKTNSLLKYHLLNASSSPDVCLGLADIGTRADPGSRWLYYRRGALEHYRAANLFSEKELSKWQELFESRKSLLSKLGIKYFVVVAPNKHSIYPEYLSSQLKPINTFNRTDQLVEHLSRHDFDNIIDTRQSLLKYRSQFPNERLYHRKNTHWNDRGAFIAYQHIAETLKEHFPRIRPIEPHQVMFRQSTKKGTGDLAGMIGLKAEMSEQLIEIATIDGHIPYKIGQDYSHSDSINIQRESTSTLPLSLQLYHDSFGDQLIPLLFENFTSINCVHHDHAFDIGEIKSQRPDVVISLWVERKLMAPPPSQP